MEVSAWEERKLNNKWRKEENEPENGTMEDRQARLVLTNLSSLVPLAVQRTFRARSDFSAKKLGSTWE